MKDIPLGSKTQLEAAEIYREAEYKILRLLSASLKKSGAPQLDMALQRRIQKLIDEAELDALDVMNAQLSEAYTSGYQRDPKHNRRKSAILLAAIGLYVAGKSWHEKLRAIGQIEAWMNIAGRKTFDATTRGITNATQTFRFAARRAQIALADDSVRNYARGGMTWMQAKQEAINALARRGITSFTDRAGRRWQIDTYVEMCVRTGIANESRAGFDQSMEERGIDLVYVSAHPGACPLCVPWEGEILSRHGDGEHPTVDEAADAGLFHPNCGHVLFEYIEGFSKLRKYDSPENSELYKNRQRQRGMERNIRHWKREAAAAVDPEEKNRATQRVREGQVTIREFTADTGLPRKYYRERVT